MPIPIKTKASHRDTLDRRRAAVALLARSVRVYLFRCRTSRRRVEAARARVHGAALILQRVWRGFVLGRVVARVMRCSALRKALTTAGNGSMRRGLARITASNHWQYPGASIYGNTTEVLVEGQANNREKDATKISLDDDSAAAAREAAAGRAEAAEAMATRFFDPAGGASISGSALLAMATTPLPSKGPTRRREVAGSSLETTANSPRLRDLPLQSETAFWKAAIVRWESKRVQQRNLAMVLSKAERLERSSMLVEDRTAAAIRARWASEQKRQVEEITLLNLAKARENKERLWREKRGAAAAQAKSSEAAAGTVHVVQD